MSWRRRACPWPTRCTPPSSSRRTPWWCTCTSCPSSRSCLALDATTTARSRQEQAHHDHELLHCRASCEIDDARRKRRMRDCYTSELFQRSSAVGTGRVGSGHYLVEHRAPSAWRSRDAIPGVRTRRRLTDCGARSAACRRQLVGARAATDEPTTPRPSRALRGRGNSADEDVHELELERLAGSPRSWASAHSERPRLAGRERRVPWSGCRRRRRARSAGR